MKFNNTRQSGYSSQLATNVLDNAKPIHSLSLELEIQRKFEDKKPTDEVQAYKAWFVQEGLPPFQVKFEEQVELPKFQSIVLFDNLQACEVGYNVYFKADDIKEIK
jgi:hypothetical protein